MSIKTAEFYFADLAHRQVGRMVDQEAMGPGAKGLEGLAQLWPVMEQEVVHKERRGWLKGLANPAAGWANEVEGQASSAGE